MTERKEHYKLYKAKKLWVTAMLATGIFIGTSVAIDPVHAATPTDQSITSTSSASEGGSTASSATSSATSSANSSATSSSASQSAASSSATPVASANSSTSEGGSAASSATSSATSSANSSATSSSVSQSAASSSAIPVASANSSASEGSSAASSATSTATSSANSSANSSSVSQSAASSASSSDRITVNTNDLVKRTVALIATSKKQVASGNWTFTSPINFSSEGSTNVTSGTLDIVGEKGDVYTLKITGDKSSGKPVVTIKGDTGDADITITNNATTGPFNETIITITFNESAQLSDYSVNLTYLFQSGSNTPNQSGFYYGKQDLTLSLSGVDADGNSLGEITQTVTVDNTIHPTVEVKRVTASSKTSIVNNVDYEYQAQIKGLPGGNDSRFLSLAGTNPITVDIPMPAGFVLNDSLTKAKMDSLWGSGNYSYTTDGQTIKVTFNNPSTTFVTKYYTNNPLAFDFVGHYVGQTGTVTASANTSFNAKFGSNQESYSTATSQPVSETFATSETAQAGDLVISGGYVDNGTTEHTIQLHNDKHTTLGSFGINNQGVAEVDNPTFTITIPSQFDVPANTLIVSRETFGDDAKLPDNLKYTITYTDGSETTYDYATTPISSLPAKNISKIIFTLPTLNPGETYKFSLPGQVNSTAKAGDETSISGEIKTMDGGEGSLSLAQQIIDTTPTTKEGVYAYSYQKNNEFRIGQYTNRGAQADITDPVIYYVLPKGFFYKNYQAVWTDGDSNYTPKITTSMVNGQQVVKLDFTGTGFILNPKWGANTAIVASAGQDTPAGTYTVKGYIYSPGVQFDGMTVATGDNQYLGQDSTTQLDSHWGYEGARTWTITSLSMIKPSAGVVKNGFVVADDTLNDHGDGTTTLGMNITNDQKVGATGNFVYKGKIPDGIIMTGAVTGLPDDVTVKYTLQDPDLASNETDNYVDASQITDWSKVKGLALFGTGLPAGQNMGLVSIPVKVVDVQNQANKNFTFNARYFDTNNSTTGISGKGTLKVAGQSTLKTQVQYTDANGKVQTIALTGTKTYNDGVDTPSERDFPVDLASLNESDRATLQKLLDQNYTMPESVSMGKVSTDSPMNVSEDGLTVTYVLGHKTVTVTPDDPKTTDDMIDGTNQKYPAGVTKADLNHTVTRTIKVTNPDGVTTTTKQEVKFTRTATVDVVTGNVTYTDWTVEGKSDKTGTWSKFDAPTVLGYTPNKNVPETTVSEGDSDTEVDITYTANPQKLHIYIYDVDLNATTKDDLGAGKSGVTVDIDGVSNQAYDETSAIQKLEDYYAKLGYKLAPVTDKYPTPVAKGKFDTDDDNDQTINIYLVHDTETQTQTITRTINYQTTEADGTHKQVAAPYTKTVTVTATVDKVTGDALEYKGTDGTTEVIVTPTGTKTKNGKNTYTITIPGQTLPTYVGYTAQAPEATSSTQAKTYSETLGNSNDSQTETVNYTPNDQKLQIRVFDDTVDATKDIGAGDSGQKVDYTGKTNTSFDESTSVSALEKYYEGKGYILDPKYPKPTTTGTYNTDDNDVQYIDIHLIHNTHQQSQTVTRTINYVTKTKDADGNPIQVEKPTTVTVTVTATIDDVTKDASDYTATDSNGKSYTVTRISTVTNGGSNQYTVTLPGQTTLPKKAGYTADLTSAATAKGDQTYTVTLDETTSEYPETVTYTPNKQDLTIVVHDDTTNTDVDVSDYGDETSFSGVSDENVSTDVAINRDKLIQQLKDKGYDVIDEGTIPENYDHDDSKGQTVTIMVTHKTVTVTPDKPKTTDDTIDGTNQKYPAGVTETDLNHTVTRTIKVTNPDGATTTTEQEVKFTRTATVDAVTGKVTYTPWVVKETNTTHGTWPNYTGPTHAGYTPVIDGKVADSATISANDQVSESDSNQTINITYQADSQKLQIRVFDDITDPDSKTDLGAGQSGDQTNFSGKTDETVPDDVKANVDALIKYYEGKGYVLVSTGDIPKNYDKTDNTGDADRVVQYVDIHLKHGTKTITVTPTDTIYTDPTSKQQYQLTYDAKRTITYQGAGDQTPAEKSETVSGAFTRQLTVDTVTGEVQNVGPWTGSHNFASVPVTPVTGYVADKATVPAITASADAENLDENGNPKAVSQTVTYTAVGRIIPVDANGKHLVDPQNYKNDSADPTKVAKNETLPTIPGYHVVSGDGVTTSGTGNNTTGTITPTNATTDTEVIYAPNAETITVRYVDADAKDPSKATMKTDTLNGNFGTDINYSTKDEIAKLFNEGYVLRQDSDDEFTSANQTQYTVENDGKTYIVTLHHGTEKVTKNQQVDGKTKINENDDRDDAPVWTDKNGIVSVDYTRTINYEASDGTSLGLSTQTQNAHWTRELTVDKVTGEVVNSTDWTTTNTYPAVTSPTVAGYTPDTDTVAEVTRPEQQNTIVTVTYTPDKQTIQVQYVDDDDNGKIVTTTDLNGVTNQTVTPEYNIPTNYEYVSGKEASYTFKASDNQPIVVHLKHQHKTGTETKTITRTVNITDPKTGKTTTTNQQVDLTRSTDTDLVTNKTTNGKWNTGTWDKVSVPKVPGYTPSQTSVDKATVTDSDTDQTVNITYTANSQKATINYVDDDDHGKIVHTTPLSGKTDQTVPVTNEIPAGYQLADGSTVPDSHTFTPGGPDTITVHLVHKHDQGSETHQATRTITVTTPDGKSQIITQTGTIKRSTDTDEVTKTTKYGDWSVANWSKYDAPVIPGYTASVKTVDAGSITPDTKDSQVTITYTANPQSTTIQYVDDDNGGQQVGELTTLSGKTDQTVTPEYNIPANYEYVSGKEASYTFKASGNQPIVVHLKHHHTTTPDQKTVTRTITVTTPDGKQTTTTQTATSTRTIDTDEVTGKQTPGAWQPATWDKFTTPTIDGYVPTVSQVAAKTVTGDTPDEQINITYSANPQTATVTYVDDETGKTVHVTSLHGDTATTVSVPNEVPAGYDLVGTFPSNYTFTSASQQWLTIHLTHHKSTVPETKTVTRTIKLQNPDGTTTTITQKATISRQVTTDAVNGNQTFTPWTTALWAKFEVPTFKGYTPSQLTVAPVTVDGNSQDETVTITYATDPAAIVYFLDEDQLDAKGQPSQVATSGYLSGNFNGPITDPNYAQTLADLQAKGYLLDDQKSTYPTQDKFDTDPKTIQTFYVYLKHQTVTTSEKKTVTRTIKVNNPDGTTKTITQAVTIGRQITTDKVTGKQTASDWSSANWTEFKVPTISGYTPSQTTVPAVTVDGSTTDQTVTINYTANPQTVTVKYVDDTTGATVKTTSVQGVAGQTVTIPDDVPSGYQVVGQLPGKYTLTSDDGQTITVHLTHQMTTVPEKKTVTRTITIIKPDGTNQTVTQTATITRQVTTDHVTGGQTFTPWSTAEWPVFNLTNLAVIPGYTPMVVKGSTAHVMVDGATEDTQTQIVYVGQTQSTTIQYVDDETGKVVQTTNLSGKTGETVTPSYQTPSGYDLVDPSQAVTSYTFKASGNQPIIIHLKHHKSTMPETKTVTRTITVINPDGTTKTVTQTATITRQVTTDQVTGEQTATDWTTAKWPAFNVPTLEGYTAKVDGAVEAVTVDATTADQVVTITYIKQATPNQPNKPNKPDQPTVNPMPSQPTSGAPVKPNSSGQSAQGALRPTAATNNDPAATTKTARLPQTGNDNSMAILSLGFASLVATLGLVIAKKREDQK